MRKRNKKKPISVSYGIGIDKHDHEGRVITLEFEDFYHIDKTWGYHSNKDGQHDCYDICEDCYDRMIKFLNV